MWRSGEPRRPTGQRGGGLSMTSGPHPSQSQVEEPVGRLPLEPSPGPDRRHWRQIFVLCVFWMLLLWLMTPCLNLKTDSAPQEKWMDGAPRDCSCPWFKFWQCGCPSGSLNHSVCHHTAGERWFDAGYEKMKRSLMGVAESTRPGAVLWWSVSGQHWGVPSHPPPGTGHLPLSVPNPCPQPRLRVPPIFTASTPDLPVEVSPTQICFLSSRSQYLGLGPPSPPSCCFQDLNAASELGRVWKKLLKVIPRPSVSHFDLFCGTCALMGNSKILRAASLSNNVNRPSMVSRWASRRGQGTGRPDLPPEFFQFLLSFSE